MPRLRQTIACLLLAASFTSCASIVFVRDTESSGTFRATGTGFTLFGVDIPRSAMTQARENASDANMHNMIVTQVDRWPYWGPLDFLLEIMSIRYAVIEGTWGYKED
ncbi:MAG: hypothetical protein ACI8X5_001546 [Planctomycetota bacterium]|jgi:hypothetical protein